MSDQQPSGAAEYLQSGAGSPLSTGPDASGDEPRRRSRRTTWLVGGGVVGLLAVGAGAWAVLSFFQQGPQPAVALPSTTVAYLGIDLDPSGGQKIDAFRTLNKFPAFKDKVGIHSVDDVRRKIGEQLIADTGCDLSYDSAIGPWLGDRAAVAAVDLGQPNPTPVVVLQVTDDAKADAGLHTLITCGDHPPTDAAYDVHDGWAVLATSQSVADQVVAQTSKASLADDATYQRWTKAVGDAGVVNFYAAPAAGDYLARQLADLESAFAGLTSPMSVPSTTTSSASATAPLSGFTSSGFTSSAAAGGGTGALDQALRSFQGAAATLRFNGSGVELATASDPALSQSELTSDQGGAVVSRLPDDTAAALGVGLRSGWFTSLVGRFASYAGQDRTAGQLMAQLSKDSGLDLPADAETLLGSSAALSIGHGFDYEAAAGSPDGQGVPVAFTVQGDPAAIGSVLDKVRAQDPGSAASLASGIAGDLVAVGPTPAYRSQVLAGGHLGDTDAFRSVVPDAQHAGVVLYVDLGSLQKALGQLAAGDQQLTDNLAPLRALGFSAWNDGGVARTSLRIGTS